MIIYCILTVLLLFSIISDIKTSKIRNSYIAFSAICGIAFNTCYKGVEGLKMSFTGILLPIILLGIFFYVRLLGAGDIKLFSAIGALLGWKHGLYIMAYSILAAGIISFILLVRTSGFKQSYVTLGRDMKLCLYGGTVIHLENSCKRHIIKLSPYISAGVLIELIIQYVK